MERERPLEESVEAEAERARKVELIDGMLAPQTTSKTRAVIETALTRFPIEMLEVAAEAGTQIRPLDPRERYLDASPALKRLGVDVDAWPVAPAGLFVVEEKTVYIRTPSVMTAAHEFGHAVDAALGGGVYQSGYDSAFRQAFASQRAFVTPYAATGLDESWAENLRAYVGGLNDPHSPWPEATPERLKAVAPQMSAYFDDVMNKLRERSRERTAESIERPAAVQDETVRAPVSEPAGLKSQTKPLVEPVSSVRAAKAERRDYRQEITDKMIAAIENGTAPWQKGWDANDRLLPFNPTTEKNYRGGNVLRLMLEGRDDPRWMTYKQAQEEGWQVRKGERGTTIEYWKFDNKDERATKATETAGDRAGEVVNGKDEERSSRPRVFYATVFNASQIDGIPPIERSEHKWEIAERAEQLIAALGVDIRYGGNRAFYAPEAEPNVINVPERGQFHSAAGFYDTLLHEAAHWTGHSDRLDRDLTGLFGSESYAKEELRAEIAGAFIAAELGIPRDTDNNAAYVASWIEVLRNDKNEIFRAATDAQRVSDFVFERALERVQGVDEARPDLSLLVTYTLGSSDVDLSSLPVYEPRPNDLVDRREDFTLALDQEMTVLGRSEDGERVFGRDGGGVLTVAKDAFTAAPRVNQDVTISRVDGKDQAQAKSQEVALER